MKQERKLVFRLQDGGKVKTKKEYLLQKLYLLELKKRELEGLNEYQQLKK